MPTGPPPLTRPPPPPVLAAFGVAGATPVPLGGGQGTSWRAAGLVLKPADLDPAELVWQAAVLAGVREDGFRLARPLVTAGGGPAVDGWCASEFLAGRHEPGRRDEVIAVGERLHAALRGIARPAFLDQRASAWAVADRVAWQQRPAGEFAAVRGLGRLAAARRPVTAPAQVVHGDLGGNVLFHPALPPAVIDFSPYWRPAGYATAIVVADALLWAGAGCVPAAAGPPGGFGQFLVRALIFRAVASWILSGGRDRQPVPGTAWTQAVNLACDLAAA